jgi:hypothetical protein
VQQKLVDNAHPGVNNTVAAEICICCGCFVRVHNINFNPLNLKSQPLFQKKLFSFDYCMQNKYYHIF